MLVLSRREGERIRLGDSTMITVIQLTGGRVRLGIDAPSDISIVRDEIRPAGQTDPRDLPMAG